MKPSLIITIIGSAIFIAVMLAWKQTAKAGVENYGLYFFVPAMIVIFALAFWMDRKPKA